jgi:hypothetical protein
MARTTRQSRPASRTETPDVDALEQKIDALRRENDELKARLAKGPTDETWFTPGLLSLLAVGLLAVLWYRYAPPIRPRGANASTAPTATVDAGEYNPPAR